MQSTQAVRTGMAALLAADTGTLAPAVNANQIALVQNPFVPSEQTLIGSLTFATFTGSTPIPGVTGAQLTGLDPVTNDSLITVKTPAGGWRWITGDLVNLPQTIYGFALTDHTGATLLGTALLSAPVILTAAGQQIDIGEVTLRLLAGALT